MEYALKMKCPHRLLAALAVLVITLANASSGTLELAAAGRSQIGVTVSYDPSYQSLKYPGGDVAADRGVCTDVVIRALRKSYGLDLQKSVHEDMKSNFSKYPSIWGLKKTDRSIDHRRVPNLQTFFKRAGYSLPVTKASKDYLPGDLVTCIVPPNLPHIMIVSDRKSADGVPLVIHNIGRGTREEDRLFEFKLVGHYRVPVPKGSKNGSDPAQAAPASESKVKAKAK